MNKSPYRGRIEYIRRSYARHAHRILEFDFARLSDPNGPRYSTPVSLAVCEECGHIELYSQMPRLLCDWLRRPDTDEI